MHAPRLRSTCCSWSLVLMLSAAAIAPSARASTGPDAEPQPDAPFKAEPLTPEVTAFIARLRAAYAPRAALAQKVRTFELEPFPPEDLARITIEDIFKRTREQVWFREVVLHPQWGVIVDSTDEEIRVRVGIPRNFTIYRDGQSHSFRQSGLHAESRPVEPDVPISESSMLGVPSRFMAALTWGGARLEPGADGSLRLHLPRFKKVATFDAHTLALLEVVDEGFADAPGYERYLGHVDTPLCAAPLPTVRLRDVRWAPKTGRQRLLVATIWDPPVINPPLKEEDFRWQTYEQRAVDTRTGTIIGADGKLLGTQPPLPPPVTTAAHHTARADTRLVEQAKADPTVVITPRQSTPWSWLAGGAGIGLLIAAGALAWRRRTL